MCRPAVRVGAADGPGPGGADGLCAPLLSGAGDVRHETAGLTAASVSKRTALEPLDLSRCVSALIFDWDDTLFPTSALSALGPDRLRDSFGRLDDLVLQVLTMALELQGSQVLLLTSANLEWVRRSSREFLPKVATLLFDDSPPNLALLSAHRPRASDGNAPASEEVSRRKLDVVRAAAEPLQALVESMRAEAVQVSSVGDGPFDLQAAHVLLGLLRAEHRFVKTVAMKPMPGIGELLGELRCLSSSLPKLVVAASSFHRSMYRTLSAKQQPKAGELQQPSDRQIPQDLVPSQPPMPESKQSLPQNCQQQPAQQPQHTQQPRQVQQRHFEGECEKELISDDPRRQQCRERTHHQPGDWLQLSQLQGEHEVRQQPQRQQQEQHPQEQGQQLQRCQDQLHRQRSGLHHSAWNPCALRQPCEEAGFEWRREQGQRRWMSKLPDGSGGGASVGRAWPPRDAPEQWAETSDVVRLHLRGATPAEDPSMQCRRRRRGTCCARTDHV
mmetsp:Transcript_125288/g.350830  ORF Transcript_125288/g.350830 Transcript_125288/m.350830 type:complete len:500 (+) Transcript_125288:129-1628(+)